MEKKMENPCLGYRGCVAWTIRHYLGCSSVLDFSMPSVSEFSEFPSLRPI